MTVIHLHDVLAGGVDDAPALTEGSVTLTYDDLRGVVSATAAGLVAQGLERFDRVAVYLDKRVETIAAIFGTSRAGGVFVPVNPVLRATQVGHILTDSGARFLVTSPERYAALTDSGQQPAELEVVVLTGETTDPGRGEVSSVAWADLLRPDENPPSLSGTDADVAAIFYTSGSTGAPKGVVLSHRNLVVGAQSVSSYLDNGPHDRILALLPLSFDAGFSQLTTGFASGAHIVLANFVFPRDVVRLCELHQITGLTCVPPLWIQLVEQNWPSAATSSLRYFANTGGRMPKTTLDRLRGIFPAARPFLMYGLTEAFRSTYLDPSEVDTRPDSIGKAIPNAEILVVRPDGTACDPGEPGELVHRGPLVALGYWGDEARTAERFRPLPPAPSGVPTPELAVWSGDTVVRDEEGFLYFVGRTDDMIKTSGYRVSPTEVEEAAYATGLVRDAVVFGVVDEALGQRIVLLAVGHEAVTVDAIAKALRRSLPHFMVPSDVRLLEELPRSANGKFDRTTLRAEYRP
jgi:acyl-CoA ligase (AMP-forming) (exosortase A-associated)